MESSPMKKPKTEDSTDEQEEILIALIAHRTKEVDHAKKKLAQYNAQMEDSLKKLTESQQKLAALRSRRNSAVKSEPRSPSPTVKVKTERLSPTRDVKVKTETTTPPLRAMITSRPQLHIPGNARQVQTPVELKGVRPKVDVLTRTPPQTAVSKVQESSRPKRKFVQRENRELVSCVRRSSTPTMVGVGLSNHIPSQHKRKQRSLTLSPADDRMFATSALDGVVNLWQVQIKGPSASLLSTIECLSPKQRRWPEDITWHPDGDSLFAVYSADAGDSQIAIINLNLSRENRVLFLDEKPHLKGIINNVLFMPWSDLCFLTGGSDHAVILWSEKNGSWKPKTVHRNEHSSAVMGVAGLQQKKTILSVGADKRIVKYDLVAGRSEHKYLVDSKCMSVLPNPSDFNLFMVQSGTPEKQLRLFDSRARGSELHAFGWKQESSESQSALINQAWSPDGLYISSGSADPKIHIFDIRYNASRPSQSIQAHQKRVFKAEWHQSLPLLISISSDLNIGLHKLT